MLIKRKRGFVAFTGREQVGILMVGQGPIGYSMVLKREELKILRDNLSRVIAGEDIDIIQAALDRES